MLTQGMQGAKSSTAHPLGVLDEYLCLGKEHLPSCDRSSPTRTHASERSPTCYSVDVLGGPHHTDCVVTTAEAAHGVKGYV